MLQRVFACAVLVASASAGSAVAPVRLLVDGVDATLSRMSFEALPPRFSWALVATPDPLARGAAQTHATVTVARDSAFENVSCTAAVVGGALSVPCAAVAFAEAGMLYHWRVCVTGNDAAGTVSCGTSTLTTALRVWTAPWVSAPDAPPYSLTRAVRLRAVIAPPAHAVVRATAYAASPAAYVLSSNGARVSDHVLSSQAEFTHRVLYDTWDVTAAFAGGGAVALGVRVGPSFYGYHARFLDLRCLPFRAEVQLELEGGGRATLAALNWSAAPDSVVAADFYKGEVVDARLEAAFAGWDTPAYVPPPGLWGPATGSAPPAVATAQLTPQDFPRIAVVATLAPVALTQPLPGLWVFAFAQMFAGVVELDVPSPAAAAGTTVLLYAGELLFANGTVDNEFDEHTNMTVSWTLAGTGGVEMVSMSWGFWGLQFAQVTGWPAGAPPPALSAMRGIVQSSAREQTGELVFAGVVPSAAIATAAVAAGVPPTSAAAAAAVAASLAATARPDAVELAAAAAERAAGAAAPLDAATLAGVQHASTWGARSNWFSVPSDCPTREKRGWMGDGAASVATYARNFALGPALRSWARSMRDNQLLNARANHSLDGIVAVVVPAVSLPTVKTDAAWSWAMAEVPATMCSEYGDTDSLASAFGGLARLLAFYARELNATAGGILTTQALYGDWCAAFNRSLYSENTKHICATATHLAMLTTAAAWATALGNATAAAAYTATRAAMAKPFRAAYAIDDEAAGEWVDAIEQAPPVLALGLGADVAGARTAAWLVHDVESTHAVHQTTGSVATRFLYPALSAIGRTDLAAAVAAQSTFPSPGFWLTLGATTCWENYSGHADGQHPPPPTHNHPFLCSHGFWMYDSLLGLRQPDGTGVLGGGYARVLAAPPLLTDLPSMAGAIDGGRGRTSLSWAWSGAPAASAARVNVTIPPGSDGAVRVLVPGLGAAARVTEGGDVVWTGGAFVPGVPGVLSGALAPDATYIEFAVAAGAYAFAVDAAAASLRPRVARACARGPLRLACPLGGELIHFVVRAGFVPDADAAADFVATGAGIVGGPASRRFETTHALEARCLGRPACAIAAAGDAGFATPHALAPTRAHLCAAVLCAAAASA